jgi:hypothetical protein
MSDDALEKLLLAGCAAIIWFVLLFFATVIIGSLYEAITCRSFDVRSSGEMVCTERRI